jgi:hypothetical protein
MPTRVTLLLWHALPVGCVRVVGGSVPCEVDIILDVAIRKRLICVVTERGRRPWVRGRIRCGIKSRSATGVKIYVSIAEATCPLLPHAV